jgi:hypothetical protein
MKEILSIMLVCASTSIFAMDCETALDTFASVSSSNGGSKALLTVQTANSNKFQMYKDTLEKHPQVNEIGGYDREALAIAISENEESLASLREAIDSTDELAPKLREIIKDSCK